MVETNSKTPSLRDAAQMALEALKKSAHFVDASYDWKGEAWANQRSQAIAGLEIALALPEPEPVAIIAVTPNGGASIGWMPGYIARHNDKLYAAPVERQPLTRTKP